MDTETFEIISDSVVTWMGTYRTSLIGPAALDAIARDAEVTVAEVEEVVEAMAERAAAHSVGREY